MVIKTSFPKIQDKGSKEIQTDWNRSTVSGIITWFATIRLIFLIFEYIIIFVNIEMALIGSLLFQILASSVCRE